MSSLKPFSPRKVNTNVFVIKNVMKKAGNSSTLSVRSSSKQSSKYESNVFPPRQATDCKSN